MKLADFRPAFSCQERQSSNHRVVLWLTPLFWVDYTRFTAREIDAHLSDDPSGGKGRPGCLDAGNRWRRKSTRGRLGHVEPPESVGWVSLQDRIDRWTGQAMAWLLRKVVAVLLRNGAPVSTSGRSAGTRTPSTGPRPHGSRPAVALYLDRTCGTHVSAEISFPLEQAGQVIHFCSAECRTRYQQSSQRAASA